jgi:tetratricopeptide (TPR) repeat protein
VNHIVIRKYNHLGEDIGFEEVMRFREVLTSAIKTIQAKEPPEADSPVYSFIKNLKPPELDAAAQAMAAATPGAIGQDGTVTAGSEASAAAAGMAAAHSFMMQQVEDTQKEAGRLEKEGKLMEARDALRRAKSTLETIRAMRKAAPVADGESKQDKPEDPYIVQRLALLTYKSKDPDPASALKEAARLLETLSPQTSNDTETLGLWGAVHKRMHDLDRKNVGACNESIRAYERGFYLRNDYYNGINFAYMLNVRAAQTTEPAEAIADFVQARRVREEVIQVCRNWFHLNKPPTEGVDQHAASQFQHNKYWVLVTLGEAYIGRGDEAQGEKYLVEAYAMNVPHWMKESTRSQIQSLRSLLEQSPLKYISTKAERAAEKPQTNT